MREGNAFHPQTLADSELVGPAISACWTWGPPWMWGFVLKAGQPWERGAVPEEHLGPVGPSSVLGSGLNLQGTPGHFQSALCHHLSPAFLLMTATSFTSKLLKIRNS